MVRCASRNRSFHYAPRETSQGLKPRARGWPLARYRRIAWPPSTCRDRRRRAGSTPSCARTSASSLAAVDAQSSGLPRVVVNEFPEFLRCGGVVPGFARVAGGETGMVTSVQRFGGSVNVHLHFHTLVLDGLFVREADGTLRFHPASPPTDDDVHRVVARVRRRLERLGVTGAASADEDADPLADESPALAGLSRAAILGRAALGPRAGRRPMRIGADPDAPWIERHVPLHAHDGGFDLHAAVHVAAGDRERLH